jgi:CRP-like cAMP-binding protein
MQQQEISNKEKLYIRLFLETIPIFKDHKHILFKCFDFVYTNLRLEFHKKDEYLMFEGDKPDKLYIVLTGSVNVLKLGSEYAT